jgi:hypothetical protein
VRWNAPPLKRKVFEQEFKVIPGRRRRPRFQTRKVIARQPPGCRSKL